MRPPATFLDCVTTGANGRYEVAGDPQVGVSLIDGFLVFFDLFVVHPHQLAVLSARVLEGRGGAHDAYATYQ